MEPRREIQEFLNLSALIIPLLSKGESLSAVETSLLRSTIERLRSSYLTWESLHKEHRQHANS